MHIDMFLLLAGVGKAFGEVATCDSRALEPSLLVVELTVHILFLGTQLCIHVFEELSMILKVRRATD